MTRAIILGGTLMIIDALGSYEVNLLKAESRFYKASMFTSVQAICSWGAAGVAAIVHPTLFVVAGSYFLGDLLSVLSLSRLRMISAPLLVHAELHASWVYLIRINVASYAMNNGDQYVIALLINARAVAIYAIGYQIGGGVLSLLSGPLFGALNPRIVREWLSGVDGRRKARRSSFVGAVASLLMGVGAVLILLVSRELGLFDYLLRSSAVGTVAMIVAAASAIHAASTVAFIPILTAARRERWWNRATWLALAIYIPSVLALTIAKGIVGTAWATLIGYLVLAVFLAVAGSRLDVPLQSHHVSD